MAGDTGVALACDTCRGSIARNMTLGWHAPRVAHGMEVEMTRALALQSRLQELIGPATCITLTPIVLRAVALTLRAHPRLNALMREEAIELVANINLALAVSLDEGLAVPVLRDADTKSIVALAEESRELAQAARAGKLAPRAYQAGTFTVTNLGMTGLDWFTPILNPPQVAILGLSRVVEKPVVRNGDIAGRRGAGVESAHAGSAHIPTSDPPLDLPHTGGGAGLRATPDGES